MNYIEAAAILNTAYSLVNGDNREPVSKQVLPSLIKLFSKVQHCLTDSGWSVTVADSAEAVCSLLRINGLVVVPNGIKQRLVQNINILKLQIAKVAYTYYMVNEFDPTEEVIPIMREIVRLAW